MHKIIGGDCIDALLTLESNSIDAVITDPPYGLSNHSQQDIVECLTNWLNDRKYSKSGSGFCNRDWDSFVPDPSIWRECYRVLKPGGHALVFAGSRTSDLMGIGLRLSGFEIRDCIQWIYGAGFPKGLDVGKKIPSLKGWKTALKPGYEPIWLIRKQPAGTICDNIQHYNTGALNIDGCRTGVRYPANVIHDGSETIKSVFPKTPLRDKSSREKKQYFKSFGSILPFWNSGPPKHWIWDEARQDYYNVAQSPASPSTAAEYFQECPWTDEDEFIPPVYCGKARTKDRNEGLENFSAKQYSHDGRQTFIENPYQRHNSVAKNHHPTVKPTRLMQYLCRLITPTGGVILDPFCGSGSTGKAAVLEGFNFIGIEKDPDYCNIAQARIEDAQSKVAAKQLSLDLG